MALTRYCNLGKGGLGVLFIISLFISSEVAAKKKGVEKGSGDEAGEADAKDTKEAKKRDSQSVAREFYSNGKSLYDEGKYSEALAAFQAAYDAKPHPTVLKSIAECQVQIGDTADAIGTLETYLASDGVKDAADVEARIAELRAKAPSVVKVTSEPAGAKIAVAGVDTGEVTPATLNLNPGEYAIELLIEGMDPVQKNVTVVVGEETALDINFAESADAEASEPEEMGIDPFEGAEEMAETSEEEKAGPPTAFWAMAALTGAALVSGTVFGTMALGDEDDYKKEPTQAKKEAGRRDAILADVSFGLAGAAAIVGTVILVTHLKKSKSESAKLKLLPVATHQEVGLSASVEF